MDASLRNRLFGLATAVGLAIVVIVATWRRTDAVTEAPVGSVATAADGPQMVVAALDRLSALDRQQRDRPEPVAADAAMRPGQQLPNDSVPCVWWESVRVSRRDLAVLFKDGRLVPDQLWRHPLLNRADRAPCPKEREEFAQLLRELDAVVAPLIKHYDLLRFEEMKDMVQAGGVREYVPAQATESQLLREAKAIHKARQEIGVHSTLEGVIEELRAQNWRPRPTGSYIAVGGKFYMQGDMPPLPRSREFQRGVAIVTSQAAQMVVSFLIARGYTVWDADLEDVFRQLAGELPRSRPAATPR